MTDLLDLTAGLPEMHLAPGDVVLREGAPGGALFVLVSGVLQITKGGVAVNSVTRAGAVVGELSLLLQAPCTATVVAGVPSVVRHAADGRALLLNHPRVMHAVAVGLAERLNFVTTYLADLKSQYGNAPGLTMVNDVLAQLAYRQMPAARPGSARDPDPDY
jgi:CRP/FNR family transcriptional regulator, cyclic AMP receptor protein